MLPKKLEVEKGLQGTEGKVDKDRPGDDQLCLRQHLWAGTALPPASTGPTGPRGSTLGVRPWEWVFKG